METWMTDLTAFVAELHPVLQFLAPFVIGLVPFLESEIGALVGTLAGLPVVLATTAAIAGNLVALAVAVTAGAATARAVAARRRGPDSPRRQKVMRTVNRFGVPVAALLAPTVVSVLLTAYIMVSGGLDRRTVVAWHAVSAAVWGVLFGLGGLGLLAVLG